MELARRELLLPTPLSKELRAQIPDTLMGVPMHGKGQEWHAAALSAFGIFYNKKMLQLLSLPPPQTWEELSHAKFFDTLSNGDPRKSSSALTMNLVVLEAIGWEKGWPLLTAIATNTRKFSMNSSDPSKAIISGEAAAGMVIDYFAYSKIAELGEDKLGFVLPASKTIINPDPIALLKGAPHEVPGARFIEFVLSPQGQRLLILPKGAPTGPKQSVLGRMSANRQAYDVPSGQVLAAVNPFVVNVPTAKVDMERMTKLQFVFSDLMGVVHIDAHKELKEAWRTATKRGVPQDKILAFLGEPLVTRDELLKLSLEWDKPLTRNTTMSKWEQKIRERYAQVVSGKALPKS
jgi:ABC-type Fe3+ transport system substrate-binding protein